MVKNKKGFTLIELMVVILIVAILAAVAIPILRGRIEAAKWSEGAAIAGTVKTAAKVCFAEDPLTAPLGLVSVAATRILLGFQTQDLDGQYFDETNFTIDSYDLAGNAQVSVSAPLSLTGTGILYADVRGWEYTP